MISGMAGPTTLSTDVYYVEHHRTCTCNVCNATQAQFTGEIGIYRNTAFYDEIVNLKAELVRAAYECERRRRQLALAPLIEKVWRSQRPVAKPSIIHAQRAHKRIARRVRWKIGKRRR